LSELLRVGGLDVFYKPRTTAHIAVFPGVGVVAEVDHPWVFCKAAIPIRAVLRKVAAV
jgi:hypothetical protein